MISACAPDPFARGDAAARRVRQPARSGDHRGDGRALRHVAHRAGGRSRSGRSPGPTSSGPTSPRSSAGSRATSGERCFTPPPTTAAMSPTSRRCMKQVTLKGAEITATRGLGTDLLSGWSSSPDPLVGRSRRGAGRARVERVYEFPGEGPQGRIERIQLQLRAGQAGRAGDPAGALHRRRDQRDLHRRRRQLREPALRRCRRAARCGGRCSGSARRWAISTCRCSGALHAMSEPEPDRPAISRPGREVRACGATGFAVIAESTHRTRLAGWLGPAPIPGITCIALSHGSDAPDARSLERSMSLSSTLRGDGSPIRAPTSWPASSWRSR